MHGIMSCERIFMCFLFSIFCRSYCILAWRFRKVDSINVDMGGREDLFWEGEFHRREMELLVEIVVLPIVSDPKKK